MSSQSYRAPAIGSGVRYLSEPEPERGVALPVAPGIRRIVAGNASTMTYWGTNTYILDAPGGAVVIDPGPDEPHHVDAILAATAGKVARIFVTHCHRDHRCAAPQLGSATGASVFGAGSGTDPDFVPDEILADGSVVDGLTAIHTPGHDPFHLCYSLAGGPLFSGDHVMGWSSTVVRPPAGNMRDYMASLERLMARGDPLLLPGHGPAIADPRSHMALLLKNRQRRERSVLAALQAGVDTSQAIATRIYGLTDERRLIAAERTVFAHLIKLAEDGAVVRDGGRWLPA